MREPVLRNMPFIVALLAGILAAGTAGGTPTVIGNPAQVLKLNTIVSSN